jgi:hypothetical protein
MRYEIPEHTSERLVVGRYWNGAGEGLHMLLAGIAMIGGAFMFLSHANQLPWMVIGAAVLSGVYGLFFLWRFRSHGRRFEEGLYIFDKPRGVFELCQRTERGTKVQSYPLASVRGAVAQDISDEGFAQYLVICLADNQGVHLNWHTLRVGETDRVCKIINEFLGLSP